MEVVAEVFLSAALELLVSKLASSSDFWKYVRGKQVRSELKKWEEELLEVNGVLNDAENKQITMPSVKKWLGDLRDLAYDMENVLDEFGYHEMRRTLVAEEEANDGEGSTSKVREFIPIPTGCIAFSSFSCMSNVKMGSKINDITRRLNDISSRRNKFGLDKVAAINQSTCERPLMTSLVEDKTEVYGRNDDKQIIINMLLRDDPAAPDVSVVPIVAMGGMGKTTLARLVYDDGETTEMFNLKAWVCVSDQFDAMRITKSILNLVLPPDQSSTDSLDFHQIQEKLMEALKGKKFLLVLDDMWNANHNDWCALRAPFSSGARGSKIIVTTRDREVAKIMGGEENLHKLNKLSDDECWLVFKKHSLIDDQSPLSSVGKNIVKRCGGLPLAARLLGGLLCTKRRKEEWDAVLASPIWESKSNIIPALRLSYNYLPPHLKRCFAYCSIFPTDYEFNKNDLILLWMAEGFIQQSDKIEEQEDLGDRYFLELLSKSFFQLSTSNTSRFVMHDLIHDLANFVAKETCLHLDAQLENDPQQKSISESVRHSSYVSHPCDVFKRFERFHKNSRLHTFMNFSLGETLYFGNYISTKVLEELIPELQHLRVLSLSEYKISEIPDSFYKLKHLRYLDLSKTEIQCLPDSISNLLYLQTLKLSKCARLSKLPASIGNLINLRHLDVSGKNKLEETPSKIGKLKDLRFLSDFMVGENNSLNILGGMRDLGGELHISKLEKVVDIQGVDLTSKQKLKSLIMEWSDGLDYSGKEMNHMDVLNSLQPHSNLEKLSIEYYAGLGFPSWASDASLLSKMVDVSIVCCRKCRSLPCLGQLPSLKRLKIQGMDGVEKVGAEFYGPDKIFRSLEYLEIACMQVWEHWEDFSTEKKSSFPCLHELQMFDCPKLTNKLPTYLPCLTKLRIKGCPVLKSPLLTLPLLKELAVTDNNEAIMRSVVDSTSLTGLRIEKISGLAKLHEGVVRELQDLSILLCEELTCLWDDDDDDGFGSENLPSLEIRHCPQLGSLGCNLRSLFIFGCHKLERLPNGWQSLRCLEDLTIYHCGKLESFPKVGFPPNLRRLSLNDCDGLKCLPDDMMSKMSNNSSSDSNNSCRLQSLDIRYCSSLIGFPEGQISTTLQTLRVEYCDNLSSLRGVCALNLIILSCPSLTGFLENSVPSTLKELEIERCKNLKSLPEGIMQQHSSNTTTTTNSALQVLDISECPSLKSFPEGKFPSTMGRLNIWNCEQLESISEEMFHSSTYNSLQSLGFCNYPNLKALPDYLSGLSAISIVKCKNLELRPRQFQNFTRLTSLKICRCENINIPLSQWGLTRLTSLRSLSIEGIFPYATSFSNDHHSGLLPTTLTSLKLVEFKNLESLASLSIQKLSSLELLDIANCPKLRSILPRKKRLPPTLSRLYIGCCQLLEERYSKEKGKDWPKIAHIPYVLID